MVINYFIHPLYYIHCIFMRNIFWFLLLLFTAYSREVRKSPLTELFVPSLSSTSSLRMSSFASSVQCIPLAADDSVVIDELMRVIVAKNFIYAADNGTLYKFTLEGKLVSSICRRGNSPSEYINVSDFQVDDAGNVWVLSRNNKALYHYVWDGSLGKKITLDNWVEKICLLGKGKMLLYAGNEKNKDYKYTLYTLDLETGTVINESLLIDDYKSAYLHVKSLNHFSTDGEQRLFYQMFNDTIYSLSDKGEATPEYILNLGGRNIPASFYEHKYRDIMDFFQNLFKESYAYGTALFIHSDASCLFSLFYNRNSYWCIRRGDETFIGDRLTDDMCLSGYELDLSEISCFVQPDNQLVVVLSPYLVMESAKKSLSKEQQKDLAEMMQYNGEDQNPVLLKIQI